MEAFLCTEDLCRHFGGVTATDCVCINIEENGLRSIIGPNGAGKTTFINIVTGRIPASSGKVIYQGKEITNKPTHELVKLGICRTFQITSVFQNLSVFENVRIAKQARKGGSLKVFSLKRSLREVTEETWAILERLGLQDLAAEPAKNLAYGDQRVLEVAIAMAGNPSILFLDEPTAGMSPAETRHISELIRGLAEEISIVLVEHDMDLVMSISDSISRIERTPNHAASGSIDTASHGRNGFHPIRRNRGIHAGTRNRYAGGPFVRTARLASAADSRTDRHGLAATTECASASIDIAIQAANGPSISADAANCPTTG